MDIPDLIDEFVNYFLSNDDMWFNPQNKYDKSMLKYKLLLEINDNNIDIFKLILVFDQLPYYIYRNDYDKINFYHNISIKYSKNVISSSLDNYNDIQKIFILLALRHSNCIEDVKESFEIIKQWRKENDKPLYRRFYKATLLKLSRMNNKLLQFESSNIIKNNFKDILDKKCTFTTFEDIIEPDNYINIVNRLEEFYKNNNINTIIVSLSGGVDSMLLLYLLSKTNHNIYAVHINYMNRDTSNHEADFCRAFCSYLGVNIMVRNITEVKRTQDKDRDIYEEITRDIRFKTYNYAMHNAINSIKNLKLDCMEAKCTVLCIALGHNKNDCIENVFSNIIKNQKYDNLNGMISFSTEKDVLISRPFLDIMKNDIYDMGLNLKIPYLYDSTPAWSERGQKRDKLIPFLNNFDDRIISGLLNLSNHMTSLYNFQDITFKNMIIFGEIPILCSIKNDLLHYDYESLHNLMSYICKTKKIPYFSKKCIRNLYKYLKSHLKNPKKYLDNRKIMLNKHFYYQYYIIYYEDC
jgi:tRNA(Ile)-lysidine synthetase-like protein